MARRRQSSQTGEEEVRLPGGLPKPYSSRVGGNKHVVYVDHHKEGEEHRRVLVLSFLADYAARRFIDVLIGKDEYRWIEPVGGRETFLTASGIRIGMPGEDTLDNLMRLELSEDERAWRDTRMEESAMRLKYGMTWEQRKEEVVEEVVEDEATGEMVTRKVRGKKGKKEKKEKAEKKPKIDRTGKVSAGELAAKLKLEARIFRGALRALGLPKPEGGWLWPAGEAEAIIDKVKKQLKSDDKKKKGKK